MTAVSDTIQRLPRHLAERVHVAGDGTVDPQGAFVLCWLHHAVRDHENPALDVALEIAAALDRPVLVYQGLGGAHRYNSDRSHTFILGGARELARSLAERGVAFAFHLPAEPTRRGPLTSLAARSCCVVTEDMPAPPMPQWTASLAARIDVPVLAVDCACVLPMRLLGKAYTRAFAFRDAAADEWRGRIRQSWPVPAARPPTLDLADVDLGFEPADLALPLDELCAACEIDHTIPPARHLPGGSNAGYERWARFRDEHLARYHRRRNDAVRLDAVSGLSPYLHHGHVSPLRIAREADAAGGTGAEKFLDELLVWREMAHGFCAFTDPERLDTTDALPSWAVDTLTEAARHRSGEPARTWEELAGARTGDALWDAAQRSLLRNGELHNNLRMTWGKAVLSWTPGPAEALAMLLDLNHRFALDGCDPNSYGGILWCLGQFDRPFKPPRPIFGTVRSRDTETHAERLDVDAYEAALAARGGWRAAEELRVLVVGGGVAGLACARALAQQGVSVCVVDKGRGPGGRLATRFAEIDGASLVFDHGAPRFRVTDPRLGRLVRSWVARGAAARWTPRVARVDGGRIVASEDAAGPWVVGAGGMHAICRALAEDVVDVDFGVRVEALSRHGNGWRAATEGGETVRADAVVVAVPPPQAAELVEDAAPELAAAAHAVEMAPCWTLMLALAAGARESVPFDLILDDDPAAVVGQVIGQHGRPGHAAESGAQWVAHASAAWSRERVDESAESTRDALLEVVLPLLDARRDEVAHAAAHRWRFARAVTPSAGRCARSPDGTLLLCGDGFGGDDVEAAILSGFAAAGRVLALVDGPRDPAASLFSDDAAS